LAPVQVDPVPDPGLAHFLQPLMVDPHHPLRAGAGKHHGAVAAVAADVVEGVDELAVGLAVPDDRAAVAVHAQQQHPGLVAAHVQVVVAAEVFRCAHRLLAGLSRLPTFYAAPRKDSRPVNAISFAAREIALTGPSLKGWGCIARRRATIGT